MDSLDSLLGREMDTNAVLQQSAMIQPSLSIAASHRRRIVFCDFDNVTKLFNMPDKQVEVVYEAFFTSLEYFGPKCYNFYKPEWLDSRT